MESKSLTLTLPWPPSVNRYWRRHGHTIHRSAEATQYIRLVQAQLRTQFRFSSLACPLVVLVEALPPDKRLRDLDNLLKALLDACTKAELWRDDSLIHDLRIVKRSVIRGGKILLHVRPLAPVLKGLKYEMQVRA